MKKVSHSDQISTAHISLSDTINPHDNDTKCKICFEQKTPLVTLCQCTGSIAYVHEDCILDWIALKMEKSDVIEIPNCQICKAKFSAALKIGSKRIDNKLLLQKMRNTTKKDWLLFSGSILACLIAFITIFMSVFFLILGELLKFDDFGDFTISLTKVGFLQLLFPAMFINERLQYFKGKWKLINACQVQLVEVTLLPKKILKR